jgi:predicted lipoprotein with Yx(FWY)xxD motif
VKRSHMLLTALLTGAVSASAVAGAQGGVPVGRSAKAASVQLRNTSLGKILVNASGFTLYMFTRDSHNKNTCVKVSGCSKVWPAATTSGTPTGGSGVRGSLLSTIKLAGGVKQITYAGHALYTYREATERGETSYVGVSAFGGKWDAVNASGGAVK